MAWTQTTVDAIEDAMLAAALAGWAEANIDGKGTRRWSLDELQKFRLVVKGAVSGATGRISINLIEHSKG